MPTQAPHARPTARRPDRPARGALLRWTLVVLAAHMGLLLSLAGTLDWRLPHNETIRSGPMQTRWLPPVMPLPSAAVTASAAKPPTTRVAQVNKTSQAVPGTSKEQTESRPTPKEMSAHAPGPAASEAQSPDAPEQVVAMVDANPADLAPNSLPNASNNTPSGAPPPLAPVNNPAPPAPPGDPTAAGGAATAATPPAPERIASASMTLPSVALAALPPSALLSYRLNGQEKGINYSATGELRWQHNDSAYEMSLSIKAFLLGTRQWRSQGEITSAGLAPTRFSDSWRSERAAHFDRVGQRIVFSSNTPTAPLEAGAQDQISLYPQLAAAMAGSGPLFKTGTRLQIQTATVRDALPWLLTLDQNEALTVEGSTLQTTKWVCQPRNRFDAKVEFWVAPEHGWMPVRIRITQVTGSFIDLNLSGHSPLPPLATANSPG